MHVSLLGKISVLYGTTFLMMTEYGVGLKGYQVDFFSQKCVHHTIDLGNCHAFTNSWIGAHTIVCGRGTVDIYVLHRV